MSFESAKTIKPNLALKNQTIDGYYVGNGVSIQGDAMPILVDQFHPSIEPMKVQVIFYDYGIGVVKEFVENESSPLTTVDVVLVDVSRDGGTGCYQDREGIEYYKYIKDGLVYDNYPCSTAKVLNVSLNVLDSFLGNL